jgi:hypothetical protein
MGSGAISRRQSSVSEITKPNAKPEEKYHADSCAAFPFEASTGTQFPGLLLLKTSLASRYFRNSADP